METTNIEIADAARSFVDFIDRVQNENATFVILREGIPVARIVPRHPKSSTGAALAALVAANPLSPADAADWHRDLVAARAHIGAL